MLMFQALALHQSKICCLTLKYNWRRSESGLMTYIMWQINHFSFSVKVGKDSPGFYAFKFWVQLGISVLAMGPKLHLQDLIGLRQ